MKSITPRLYIPGPVEVQPEVLAVLSEPIIPHYGQSWVERHQRVVDTLKEVFNTTSDVFILAGSGTCAIDSCLSSAFAPGDEVVIGNNGFFGDRLVEIALANGLEVHEVKQEWGKPIDPQSIGLVIKKQKNVKGVAIVHCETSTTIINPIKEIGEIAKEKGLVFMVDAVSALGGIPYDMDKWGIDLCASASQKCLGAPPGLAPVAVSKRAWQMIDKNDRREHGWYTDLKVWRRYAHDWGDWHPTPVTMPTSTFKALDVALQLLVEEGIASRLERFKSLSLRLREGLKRAGMPAYTDVDSINPVLTAAYPPIGHSSGDVVQYLLKEHNIQISGGLGELKHTIFRIGHMSPVITESDIDILSEALCSFKA